MAREAADLWNKIGDAIAACLPPESVRSLGENWRKYLVEPHGTAEPAKMITTGVTLLISKHQAWITITSFESKRTIMVWAPALTMQDKETREIVEKLVAALGEFFQPDRLQRRGITPFEWLVRKGWKPEDLKRIRLLAA